VSLVTQGLSGSGLMTQGYGGLRAVFEIVLGCDITPETETDIPNTLNTNIQDLIDSSIAASLLTPKLQNILTALNITSNGCNNNTTEIFEKTILGDQCNVITKIDGDDITDPLLDKNITGE